MSTVTGVVAYVMKNGTDVLLSFIETAAQSWWLLSLVFQAQDTATGNDWSLMVDCCVADTTVHHQRQTDVS